MTDSKTAAFLSKKTYLLSLVWLYPLVILVIDWFTLSGSSLLQENVYGIIFPRNSNWVIIEWFLVYMTAPIIITFFINQSNKAKFFTLLALVLIVTPAVYIINLIVGMAVYQVYP